MLNSIIVGGDAELVGYLRQVCGEFTDICVYKILGTSARRYEIVAALNAYSPDVVFLDVSDSVIGETPASICLQELLRRDSSTAVVPFCKRPRLPSSREDPILALGPALTPPFNAEQLERAVREALRQTEATADSAELCAFLPGKPGAGATTVALNVAAVLTTSFQCKTLVIEADTDCASLAYLLNLNPAQDAAQSAWNPQMLSENEWNKAVSNVDGIDILPATTAPDAAQRSRWDFCRLLRFARKQYDAVIVDLPSTIDEIAEVVIAESDHAILVATPDRPSLSMARRRMWELERRAVRRRHVQLLVNRYSQGDLTLPEMTALAERAVDLVLPEDAAAVKCATRRNGILAPDSKLAREILSLTANLFGLEPPSKAFFGPLLKKITDYALRTSPQRPFQSPLTRNMEANSEFYYSGGRRQLDRR